MGPGGVADAQDKGKLPRRERTEAKRTAAGPLAKLMVRDRLLWLPKADNPRETVRSREAERARPRSSWLWLRVSLSSR
jgi:hypothetical protein